MNDLYFTQICMHGQTYLPSHMHVNVQSHISQNEQLYIFCDLVIMVMFKTHIYVHCTLMQDATHA